MIKADFELWKDIKGYEGFYQISNLGRVKGLDRIVTSLNGTKIRRKGQIMKHLFDNNGYPMVHLRKEGNGKKFKIHRLVAQAFIPNPNNLPMVNHKDESRTNNNVDNLEWCDCKYNSNYGTRNSRISKTKSKPIYQYELDGKFKRKFESISEAVEEGFNMHGILHCCEHRSKTSQGYIWTRELKEIDLKQHTDRRYKEL